MEDREELKLGELRRSSIIKRIRISRGTWRTSRTRISKIVEEVEYEENLKERKIDNLEEME